MSTLITPGTRVMYARSFLQSIGAYTGLLPFARGEVLGITHDTIATVRWDNDPEGEVIPTHANVANLVREDRLHLEPR